MLWGLPPWYDPLPDHGPPQKNERFSTSGQQDDAEARLNSLVWACCSIIPKSHDVKAGGVQARQHHGQVVGLGAAVGQVHHLREASARVITASGGGKNRAVLGQPSGGLAGRT